MMGNGYGGMWFGPLIWIGIAVLVVWLIATVVGGRKGSGTGKESALEVLERRYAAGEIGEEEFERMREKLRQ